MLCPSIGNVLATPLVTMLPFILVSSIRKIYACGERMRLVILWIYVAILHYSISSAWFVINNDTGGAWPLVVRARAPVFPSLVTMPENDNRHSQAVLMKSSHKCSLNSINTVYLGTWQWQQALWTQSLWWTCWCVSVQRRSAVGGLRWWMAQKKNHSPLLLAVELCVYECECGHVRLCMYLYAIQTCAVRQAYSKCVQCISGVEERSQYTPTCACTLHDLAIHFLEI